ncbi:MAG: sulfatase-like hydrolase/transferase [Planctomycetota bacterium]|nr:sulfatase-like hydrolase/transferase [Planctomycetota bacterium]
MERVTLRIKQVAGPAPGATIRLDPARPVTLVASTEIQPRYSLDEMLRPIWASSRAINETLVPVSQEGARPEGHLLFAPKGELVVRDYTLKKTYEAGVDYIVEGNCIRLTETSAIPFLTEKQLHPHSKDGSAETVESVKGGYLLAGEGLLNRYQLAVTYDHEAPWPGPVPSNSEGKLSQTKTKLANGSPLKIALLGDSISVGASASGRGGKPPYVPGWGDLFVRGLRQAFTSPITFVNPSTGGANSAWGTKVAPFFVAPEKPDLCVIAFGMNDGNAMPVDTYRTNIGVITNQVRATNPETEFILVAPMLKNEDWRSLTPMNGYLAALKTFESEHVAVADVWSVSEHILKTKRYCDISGNHINHPNDFMVRVYAQVVSALLAKPETHAVPSAARASPNSGTSRASKPNIIVILADDMGYADTGFNGGNDIPTPHLDSIAKNGIRFSAGYVTAPQCAPSRAGLLMGVDQNRIGCENNNVTDIAGLSEGTTFADRMRAAGYRTGMVGKWHLGTKPGQQPLDRGFDEFFGFLRGSSWYLPQPGQKSIAQILEGRKPIPVGGYLTDAFGERAVRFITENHAKPFFLYLAFNAPHSPYEAPAEEIAKFAHIKDDKRRTYAAMVSIMDRNIGRVLAALKTADLEQNTLVAFLSDNGGPRDGYANNTPLHGWKGDTFEGGIRIPFVMQWPGTIKPGQAVDMPVSSLDLLPTSLAMASRPIPPPLAGKNLLPALRGETPFPERTLAWRFVFGPAVAKSPWAVRDGNWKLVQGSAASSEVKLFDLSKDASEANDLSAERTDIRDRLHKAHDSWVASMPAPYTRVSIDKVLDFIKAKQAGRARPPEKSK